jgi:hypothetical protein
LFRVGGVIMRGGMARMSGAGAPTGTTGVGKAAPGSVYTNVTTGVQYVNIGTKAAPVWASQVMYAEALIPAADIVATGAGKFGHAAGQPIVASPGVGSVLELLGAVLIFDYATAAYTAGGNVTVNISGGGAALTGLISNANSVGAAVDKIVQFQPLAAAAANLTADTGFNLVSSVAFTQPGTAAGVIRVKVAYRVHATGL